MNTATVLAGVSNDGASVINQSQPYVATVNVEGVAPILFHRWSVDSIDVKERAPKGSKAKKEDDLESYVFRDMDGNLAIPTEYFRMAVIGAAKFKQDPRSPRKSAMDLFKAGIACLTELNSLGTSAWDYVDRRRAQVQRSGINRSRPAMRVGWKVGFQFQVLLPEYISPALLNETIQSAGRLIGVSDFRPTFGRFQVVKFEID